LLLTPPVKREILLELTLVHCRACEDAEATGDIPY